MSDVAAQIVNAIYERQERVEEMITTSREELFRAIEELIEQQRQDEE